MIRTGYKVVYDPQEMDSPTILKVDTTDLEATDWRTAKKALRKWYLDKAAELRQVSEKSYFSVVN